MRQNQRAFIIHSFTSPDKKRIYLLGRLENGKTFAVSEERFHPRFYIRVSDLALIQGQWTWLEEFIRTSSYKTMDGETCLELVFPTHKQFIRANELLENKGVRTYEADLSLTEQFFIYKNIHNSLRIKGEANKGRNVDYVFRNPQLTPADWEPELTVLSIDIETEAETNRILAISLVGHDPWKNHTLKEVLFLGKPLQEHGIRSFADEPLLLKDFSRLITLFDPDIITGWNVTDFDFKVIAERFAKLGLPLGIGRSSESALFLDATDSRKNRIIIPGRQVIDAMWLIRSSPDRYLNYSLETVSQTLLGEGKEISSAGADKVKQLAALYRNDPLSFCRYCLKDAQLVLDILEKTGLLNLTLKRAQLTGVGLDRAWTSIAPFEHLYIEQMHKRGLVAPTFGVDRKASSGAKGGLVLSPQSGLFTNVLVFDFKSLYPSIMRTFNIDPISFIAKESGQDQFPADPRGRPGQLPAVIEAPNGALFKREQGILPGLIETFFENREQAKKQNDHIASYVYKILMNSFYGVLGASGCRFGSSLLAGAITGFGQKFLFWCKELLTAKGFKIIYGDTDSLFVNSGHKTALSPDQLNSQAWQIAQDVNDELSRYVEKEYQLPSHLELEFEKIYWKLFIPPIRGGSLALADGIDVVARGRSKGYAGLIQEPGGSRMDIKGMEAVRRDWTDLAHEFQITLLDLLFHERPKEEIAQYIRDIQRRLLAGELDPKLVYRKGLRGPVSSYTKVKPPHVRAAELMGWKEQRGVVEYVITQEGPQPVEKITAGLDYHHYIERQLKPIAESFSSVLPLDLKLLFNQDQQLSLF